MPAFDYSITLGALVNAVAVVMLGWGAYRSFEARVNALLENQAEILRSVTDRFEAHEKLDHAMFQEVQKTMTVITGEVHQLIGRLNSKLT